MVIWKCHGRGRGEPAASSFASASAFRQFTTSFSMSPAVSSTRPSNILLGRTSHPPLFEPHFNACSSLSPRANTVSSSQTRLSSSSAPSSHREYQVGPAPSSNIVAPTSIACRSTLPLTSNRARRLPPCRQPEGRTNWHCGHRIAMQYWRTAELTR